jgi:DNA-binding transcriptional regulator GbsR (MarR family)
MNITSLNKALSEMQKLREEHSSHEALIAHTDMDIRKMKDAIHYYKWLSRLIDTFESGQIYDLVPKEDTN